MAETTNLYLLIFPERSVVKIGKADDIHNRIKALRRWWGEVDYRESYHLSASREVIFKLEKSLHFLLSQHAVPFPEGDGRTELFSIEALEISLKHIDIYCTSSSDISRIQKGISLPLPISSPPLRRSKHAALVRKERAVTKGVISIAEQFSRINRLLIILLRKERRIAYEYDIVDGSVYFRLSMPDGMRVRRNADGIRRYFSFEIDDFSGFRCINCCSVSGVGEIVQFRVSLPPADGRAPWQELLSCLSFQSKFLLKKLPRRSAAAKSSIPLFDGWEVWKTTLSCYQESVL